VSAQIYSTAEASLRASRQSGCAGMLSTAPTTSFRSTSSYSTNSTSSIGASSFSATTVQFANGSIQTAASSLTGGVLADDAGFISTENNTNQTSTSDWNDDEDGWGPGTPDLPLGLDWDAFIVLLLLAAIYAFRLYKKRATTP